MTKVSYDEKFWDNVAKKLIRFYKPSDGKIVHKIVDLNDVYVSKRQAVVNKLTKLGDRFKEVKIKLGSVLGNMIDMYGFDRISKDKALKKLATMIIRYGLEKRRSIQFGRSENIEDGLKKVADVEISINELNDFRKFFKMAGDNTAVEFIEVYVDNVAKEIIGGYIGQILERKDNIE